MAGKYQKIRRTPGFVADYSEIRSRLKEKSPIAYCALPSAMTTIFDVMEKHPHAWPIKRKILGGIEHVFHLAVMDIAYRRIHVRYYVDEDGLCHLLAVWVDGQDEPNYVIDIDTN